MNWSQIENNVLLFLDPIGRYREQSWDFQESIGFVNKPLPLQGRNSVVRFSRDKLINYYVTSIKQFLFGKEKNRSLFFMNDGLLCSLFDASNTSAYRAFAATHLPKPTTFRQRIVAKLPLVLRAESRFMVTFSALPQAMHTIDSEIADLERNTFMFFSNAAGKLLLTTSKTLQTGHGEIIKTTTDPDYAAVMAKEFDTVALLSKKLGKAGCLPTVGKHLEVAGRHFFTEEYICGESLRERLRELGERTGTEQTCRILDRLDEWFRLYQSSFKSTPIPVSIAYAHLIPLFSSCYGAAGTALLQAGIELLRQLENAYPAVVPITAHNDLWPGNIVMTESSGFTVIDWERATDNRAPFFDYFWMIISTSIEYLASKTETNDYSQGVRMLLRCEGSLPRHAFKKIRTFLDEIGIAEAYLPHLLFVFFMEWSIQGFQVLGRQTDMDRLAFGELLHYSDQLNATGVCLTVGDPLVRVSSNA